ncbi:MAG: hypothetical protein AAGN35_05165 [Bacteroidota bacterium]
MKFLLHVAVVIALGLVLALFLPWWGVALAGGIAALALTGHLGRGFLAGLLGIFLLWTVVAFLQVNATDSQLHEGFAELLPLPLSGTGLIFFSGLVGGLVAGLGGLSGSSLRRIVFPSRRR